MIGCGETEDEALRTHRPARGLTAILLLGLLALGCRWYAWEPREKEPPLPPEIPATDLAPGQTLTRELNCPAGHCMARFRIEVTRNGRLEVRVQPLSVSPDLLLGVILEDPIGRVLDQQDLAGRELPLRVTSSVELGPYIALVRALGGAVSYRVSASFRPGPAATATKSAAPAPPKATRVAEAGSGSRTGSVYDPKIDFQRFRHYAFATEPKAVLDAALAEGENPFTLQTEQRAARTALGKRGFTEVPATEADFLVSIQTGKHSTTWYSVRGTTHHATYDRYFDTWGAGGTSVAHSYSDNTVALDFIDPKSGELIWHGWTTEASSPTADRGAELRSAIGKVVDKFPPE